MTEEKTTEGDVMHSIGAADVQNLFVATSPADREALGEEGLAAVLDLLVEVRKEGACLPRDTFHAGWNRLLHRSGEYKALLRNQCEKFADVGNPSRIREFLNLELSGWLGGYAFFCLACAQYVPLPETSACPDCGRSPLKGGASE